MDSSKPQKEKKSRRPHTRMWVAYAVPETSVNPSSWGPTSLPSRFVGVPYTPFSKGERLGRAAQFGSLLSDAYGRRGGDHHQFGLKAANEDDDYELVDVTGQNKTG